MEGPAPTLILAASRPQPTGGQTLGVRRFLHCEERQLAISGRASSHGDSRVFPCTANVRSGRTARPAGHHPSVRVAFRHPVTGEQSPRRLPEEDRGQMGPQTPGHHRRPGLSSIPGWVGSPFKTYAEKWFHARGLQPSTKKVGSYLDSQLLPAFGDVPLKDVDRFVVQQWVETLVDPFLLRDPVNDQRVRRAGPASRSAGSARALSTFLARGSIPGSSSPWTSSRTSWRSCL